MNKKLLVFGIMIFVILVGIFVYYGVMKMSEETMKSEVSVQNIPKISRYNHPIRQVGKQKMEFQRVGIKV